MLGVVGISLTDFDQLDWPQVESISSAYQNKEQEVRQTTWEQTRQLMLVTIRPHLKKGTKISPQDILKFPWDSGSGDNILSEEDAQATAQKLNDYWEKLDKKKNRDVEQ